MTPALGLLSARYWLAACLMILSACGRLPVLASDPAPSGAPVQLQGARGPLTVAQSRTILERLASRGQPTDIFERHLAIEEAIVGSPLTTGNQVRLLQDGPATYQAMYTAILAATDHINMETYILDDDEVGQRFVQALITKQGQGVQVNLIYDSMGTLGIASDFFQNMAASGIQLLEFNPLNPLIAHLGWSPNQRDHRKLLIVDGRIAFLGGINISSVYSGGSFRHKPRTDATDTPAWRDTDLQLQGPVVAELQKLFIETWDKQSRTPLQAKNYFPLPINSGREVVRAIGSSPDEPYSLIYATLLSAIGSAETSVCLTNAYFVPDPQLLGALEDAVKRGVDVTLILPSQTDSWLVFHAGRAYYDRLLQGGIKIHERRGVILHSKTALIDGVWATVGSTNLDWRSFLHNQELNAVILGADFGQQVQTMFNKDLAASDQITLAQWQERSIQLRIKEWFAGLWEYWL